VSQLRRGVPYQSFCFILLSVINGLPLTGAQVDVYVSQDKRPQKRGQGVITEQGNGQYSYQPTWAETGAISVSFLFIARGANLVNMEFFTEGSGALSYVGWPDVPIRPITHDPDYLEFRLEQQRTSTPADVWFLLEDLRESAWLDIIEAQEGVIPLDKLQADLKELRRLLETLRESKRADAERRVKRLAKIVKRHEYLAERNRPKRTA
jgi:hypothetical protein